MGLAGVLLLSGCRSPDFAYDTPPARMDATGPTIAILPVIDSRTNLMADHVFRKGYLASLQGQVGQELQSMRAFSSVAVVTGSNHVNNADFQMSLTLRHLEWRIPHHGGIKTEKIATETVDTVVGIPLTSLFLRFKTPVYGQSAMDVTVLRTSDQKLVLNTSYSDTITNRFKKSECDKTQTKVSVMVSAFQETQSELKDDLLKELLQSKYANTIDAGK